MAGKKASVNPSVPTKAVVAPEQAQAPAEEPVATSWCGATPDMSEDQKKALAKSKRLELLAQAREKAHAVLKEKRAKEAEQTKDIKASRHELAAMKRELKAQQVEAKYLKLQAERERLARDRARIQKDLTKLPQAEPTLQQAEPEPTMKRTKPKRVIIEESSETESEEEVMVVRKPRRRAAPREAAPRAQQPAPAPMVVDPVASMTKAQIREDLRRIQLETLAKSLWG